jgi:hypothetical protein
MSFPQLLHICLPGLEFELRALNLLGRHSTTWATPLASVPYCRRKAAVMSKYHAELNERFLMNDEVSIWRAISASQMRSVIIFPIYSYFL